MVFCLSRRRRGRCYALDEFSGSAEIMTTLTIIYISFASGVTTAKHYSVPANECRAIVQQIRRNVKAGRVWGFCK